MLAAVVASAVFNNTCIRVDAPDSGQVTHHCPLCYETSSKDVLAGDGVVWHVGANFLGLPPCPSTDV